MRPVDRGDIPQEQVPDPQGTGFIFQDKSYREYTHARADLILRLGEYCSYCERRLSSDCAVEHVQPKKGLGAQPQLTRTWSNFLLGCRNCNSVKGHKPITLSDYFWPDSDNTFRAFVYLVGGRVHVNNAVLNSAQIQTALRTIALTNFVGRPDGGEQEASDRRMESRRQVWEIAQQCLNELQADDTPGIRRTIALAAMGHGYFSVWMTVFSGDDDMKLRFIRAFINTAPSCFDAHGNPIPRPGGQI